MSEPCDLLSAGKLAKPSIHRMTQRQAAAELHISVRTFQRRLKRITTPLTAPLKSTPHMYLSSYNTPL